MAGGVGVLSSHLGVVNSRPGLTITIGGHKKSVFKWVADTVVATKEAQKVLDLSPIGDEPLGLFFDVFLDGQWGWAMLGRNFQVLFVTLTDPFTGRGFVAHAAIMDVKSTDDYVNAIRPFAQVLLAALESVGADGENVRFHTDEEDAMTAALTQLVGGHLVGCRFHKAQDFERHLKVAFNKKRYQTSFLVACTSVHLCAPPQR
jgi:hypothetical protein